jgi:hypothetical protein
MSVRVSPLSSDAVVEVPDDLLERYVSQGWAVVETEHPSDEPAKRRGRPPKIESE